MYTARGTRLGSSPLQYRGDLNNNPANGFPAGQPIYLVHPLQTYSADQEAIAAITAALAVAAGVPVSLIGSATAADLKAQPFLQFDGSAHNAGILLPVNGVLKTLWLTQYQTLTDGVTEYSIAEVKGMLPPPPPPPPVVILPPPPVIPPPSILQPVIGEGPAPMQPPVGVDINQQLTPNVFGEPAPTPDVAASITATPAPAVPSWAWIAGALGLLLLTRKRS